MAPVGWWLSPPGHEGPRNTACSPELLLLLLLPLPSLPPGPGTQRESGVWAHDLKHFFRTEVRNRPVSLFREMVLVLRRKESHLLSCLLTLQPSQACLGASPRGASLAQSQAPLPPPRPAPPQPCGQGAVPTPPPPPAGPCLQEGQPGWDPGHHQGCCLMRGCAGFPQGSWEGSGVGRQLGSVERSGLASPRLTSGAKPPSSHPGGVCTQGPLQEPAPGARLHPASDRRPFRRRPSSGGAPGAR